MLPSSSAAFCCIASSFFFCWFFFWFARFLLRASAFAFFCAWDELRDIQIRNPYVLNFLSQRIDRNFFPVPSIWMVTLMNKNRENQARENYQHRFGCNHELIWKKNRKESETNHSWLRDSLHFREVSGSSLFDYEHKHWQAWEDERRLGVRILMKRNISVVFETAYVDIRISKREKKFCDFQVSEFHWIVK